MFRDIGLTLKAEVNRWLLRGDGNVGDGFIEWGGTIGGVSFIDGRALEVLGYPGLLRLGTGMSMPVPGRQERALRESEAYVELK